MEKISLIEVPAQQVLGMKTTGSYRLIPELIMKIYESAVEKNLAIAGAPMFLCHEASPDAVKEANEKGTAIVEVAWPVAGRAESSGDAKIYTLPGGKMARTVHRGPYETCEPTYLRLFSWIFEHNLQITGPIREIYPNDPRQVEPEEIITEILVPVK